MFFDWIYQNEPRLTAHTVSVPSENLNYIFREVQQHLHVCVFYEDSRQPVDDLVPKFEFPIVHARINLDLCIVLFIAE